MSQEWITRIKVLVISAIFVSIGNAINTWKSGNMVSPLSAIPGLLIMLAMVIIALLLQKLIEKTFRFHLPTILYITMISMISTLPASPIQGLVVTEFGKIGLLPLCTPILAYAGISIGKDWADFKKQGLAIVVVALCTFAGTYIGSAVIAQVLLKLTGVI